MLSKMKILVTIIKIISQEQLRAIHHAGGVIHVTLAAKGGLFFVAVATQSGETFTLSKARSKDPRGFIDPRKAMIVLRGMGITLGQFDWSHWNPEHRDLSKLRPERAKEMRKNTPIKAAKKTTKAPIPKKTAQTTQSSAVKRMLKKACPL
jgi:hypothetical protein